MYISITLISSIKQNSHVMRNTVLRWVFLLINDQKIPNMSVVLLVITNHSDKYIHKKNLPRDGKGRDGMGMADSASNNKKNTT